MSEILDPEDMSPFEPEEDTPEESEFWSNALGLLFQVCLLLVIAGWVKDYGLFKSYFEFFGNPMIPGKMGCQSIEKNHLYLTKTFFCYQLGNVLPLSDIPELTSLLMDKLWV